MLRLFMRVYVFVVFLRVHVDRRAGGRPWGESGVPFPTREVLHPSQRNLFEFSSTIQMQSLMHYYCEKLW